MAPEKKALENACGKALSIQPSETSRRALQPLVIGSDQVCITNLGKTLHKPGTKTRAIQQLHQVSGQWVTFHTGLVLVRSKRVLHEAVVQSRVKYRVLSDPQIRGYVDADKPFQSAGSLLMEGAGLRLIEQIETSDINALYGLPALKLLEGLYKLNWDLSYET